MKEDKQIETMNAVMRAIVGILIIAGLILLNEHAGSGGPDWVNPKPPTEASDHAHK